MEPSWVAAGVIALAGVALLASHPADATSYWLADPANLYGTNLPVPTPPQPADSAASVVVINPGSAPVTARLKDATGTVASWTIAPGASVQQVLGHVLTETSLGPDGYMVESDDPIRVAYFSPIKDIFTNDASRVLARTELGKEYLAVSYGSGTYIDIVATRPGTEVKVSASVDLTPSSSGTVPAIKQGTTATFTLNAYDVLHLMSATGAMGDVTGTRVSSSKPVAAFSGAPCINVDGSACDHISEQLFPLERAGKDHVLCSSTLSKPKGFDRVRVMAVTGAPQVSLDPPAGGVAGFALAGPGAVQTFDVTTDTRITSTTPVLVWAIWGTVGGGSGEAGANTGDPAMVLLTPLDQWKDDYWFLTPDEVRWIDSVAVAARAGTAITVDGVPASGVQVGFSPYVCVHQSVTDAVHHVHSDKPSLVSSLGYGDYSSYWYEAARMAPPNLLPTALAITAEVGSGCGLPGLVLDGSSSFDPDGDILSWAWAFDDGTSASGPTVPRDYVPGSTFSVTLTVTDDDGGTAQVVLVVTAPLDPNCPPHIHPVRPAVVLVGQDVQICAQAEDPDEDPIAFSLVPLPQGATFDPVTGCLTWTPHPGQEGSWCLFYSASDGEFRDSTCGVLRVVSPGMEPTDTDHDGIADLQDNCVEVPNRDQADNDGDGLGDACDARIAEPDTGRRATTARAALPDSDRDGVPDGADLCPQAADPQQHDLDGDHVGDACDPDRDGDGVAQDAGPAGFPDNCPALANADQTDDDGDGVGDACQAGQAEVGPVAAAKAATRAQAAQAQAAWMPAAAITAGFAAVAAVVLVLFARGREAKR